jgi:hypothetical protein
MRHPCWPVALIAALPGFAQWNPDGAHVNLYFPQFADGGSPAQQWQTSFVFLNPHETLTANVALRLYGNNGQPLTLNLGLGPLGVHAFSIPPRGTRTLRSAVVSPVILTGWAHAAADLPLQSTVLFRFTSNGVPQVEVSASATLPSAGYWSPATGNLGIALANVYSDSLTVDVVARNSSGAEQGRNAVSLGPLGHTSFNLFQVLPGLPANFSGSVHLLPRVPTDEFLAWTLNGDRGLISSLPPGRLEWPISHFDRIWLVYRRVLSAARVAFPDIEPVTLQISNEQVVNAFARSTGVVQINLALSELISDSASELAFVVAHEIGHVAQFRRGGTLLLPNREQDADGIGMLLALSAGFDPYAGAGALAKLSMANDSADLVSQEFDDLNDPHTSWGTRIDTMFDVLRVVCVANPAVCSRYKSVIHPHFPPSTPLAAPDLAAPPRVVQPRELK